MSMLGVARTLSSPARLTLLFTRLRLPGQILSANRLRTLPLLWLFTLGARLVLLRGKATPRSLPSALPSNSALLFADIMDALSDVSLGPTYMLCRMAENADELRVDKLRKVEKR